MTKTPAGEDVFQKYSEYYDLLYKDKDYVGEADYMVRLVSAAAPGARSLLEFGSGTGKHGRLLADRGYDVHGVERSEGMVAIARQAAAPKGKGSFASQQGDIRTVRVDRTFDVVLSLFHVVSYQTTNEDLKATFHNAARHLGPNGIFVFDVWHGPAVLTEQPTVRVKRVEDERTRLTRVAEPSIDTTASIVTVRYTMFAQSKADESVVSFDEEHFMRYLFPTEIDLLARDAGFTVERTEEFATSRAPSPHTWGVAYVLRKSAK